MVLRKTLELHLKRAASFLYENEQDRRLRRGRIFSKYGIIRRQQLCCVSYCIHSGDTDLLLLLLLFLFLAGTLSSRLRNALIYLIAHSQMHFAVSDVVLQQEAHI